MNSQKYITIITSFVSVFSLTLAVVYHCENKEFETNILVGVFSSGFLAMLVSIIEYANIRRNTLEKFYTSAHSALHNINQYRTDLEIDVAIEKVLSIFNYNYGDLDTAYGAMCFFFYNKKTRKYIYDAIYHPILQLRDDLTEVCYHLSLFEDGVSKNEELAKEMIDKATQLLMDIDEFDTEIGDEATVHYSYVRNKFYEPIEKELNGRYWNIMYLSRKKANNNDVDQECKENKY